MKEELTSKMHSEFTVDAKTELSIRVGTLLRELHDGGVTLDELLEESGITLEQYNEYRPEWEALL